MGSDQQTHLSALEPAVLEKFYQQFLSDPESMDESWRNFFKGFDFAMANFRTKSDHEKSNQLTNREFKVINLINGYRQRGHLFTKTNPVRQRRSYFPTLEIQNFGLEIKDLNDVFQAGSELGIGPAKLDEIIKHLEETYCESVGVEYFGVRHPHATKWLQTKMESCRNKGSFSPRKKRAIYKELMKSVEFEQFIHRKFIGEKRFSLEGAEGLIPALWALCIKGVELGAKEFVIGMPHRGRLNVLANVMEKPYTDIFREFEANEYEGKVSLGDVKYHLGYGRDTEYSNGTKVRFNLVPNPSHLEAVLPLIKGVCRAKVDKSYNGDFDKLVPIAIHGDAAIAGQGVVYETIQMAKLDGYKTGGTIHIVVNNQVGFTTNYLEGRSSTYCTDVAKVTRSPIFHVNGDDVEALVYTMQLAMEYRNKYNSDVFVDILSYRKHGHNEGDEPRFTQPKLYKIIANHPNPKEIYVKKLISEGVLSQSEAAQIETDFIQSLENELTNARSSKKLSMRQFLPKTWENYRYSTNDDFEIELETGVEKSILKNLLEKINHLPKEIKFFKKSHKIIDDRKALFDSGKVDWATAELLAYASLVNEKYSVRLSGQDSVRGTFAHRHAEITIENSEIRYNLFQDLNSENNKFEVYNSPLSEYGVLGFEYGYSLAAPKTLTIWEAQFGDFHNVAQVIIDQYIASGEEKWGLMNGLTLYLPHGYEGQGPEHSSARIERFLNLAARNNLQIISCTTPANLFHAIRRQMTRDFRIPMIIFTPKSLLRHPLVISSVDSLASGTFQTVIDDENVIPENVTRVVFCTGKIYYELKERKDEFEAKDLALVRIEQLHPFPKTKIKEILEKYPNALLHLWIQEEPENMGAWRYIRENLTDVKLIPVARIPSGSPATGLKYLHKIGQEEIISKVFRKCTCERKNKYCGLQCVEGASHKEILKQHYYFEGENRFSI